MVIRTGFSRLNSPTVDAGCRSELCPVYVRLLTLVVRPRHQVLGCERGSEHSFQPPIDFIAILCYLIVDHEAVGQELQALFLSKLHKPLRTAACGDEVNPAHIRMNWVNRLSPQSGPESLDPFGHDV